MTEFDCVYMAESHCVYMSESQYMHVYVSQSIVCIIYHNLAVRMSESSYMCIPESHCVCVHVWIPLCVDARIPLWVYVKILLCVYTQIPKCVYAWILLCVNVRILLCVPQNPIVCICQNTVVCVRHNAVVCTCQNIIVCVCTSQCYCVYTSESEKKFLLCGCLHLIWLRCLRSGLFGLLLYFSTCRRLTTALDAIPNDQGGVFRKKMFISLFSSFDISLQLAIYYISDFIQFVSVCFNLGHLAISRWSCFNTQSILKLPSLLPTPCSQIYSPRYRLLSIIYQPFIANDTTQDKIYTTV